MAEPGMPPQAAVAEPPPPEPPRPDAASRRRLIKGGVGAAVTLAVGSVALLAACESLISTGGLQIRVNGRLHTVQAAPDTPLLYVLRNELDLRGPHFGCGLSQCGACTVLAGDTAIRACVTKVSSVSDKPITTLEGLGSSTKPGKLQQAFIDEQAAQCAFCINGMIMQAAALLKRKAHPTVAEIKTELTGHLCRCGTHMRIVRAVQRAAGTLA